MACENDKEDKCCKKIVKKVAAPRRLGANAIPEEILLNKSLNDAIAATLPKNYNFVLDLKINKSNTVDLDQYFMNYYGEMMHLINLYPEGTNRFSRFYSHFNYCKLFSISR